MKRIIEAYFSILLLSLIALLVLALTFAPLIIPIVLVVGYGFSPLWFLLWLSELFIIPIYIIAVLIFKGELELL